MAKRRGRSSPRRALDAEGSPWARDLYRLYLPVRVCLQDRTEEEINQAIADALREVRSGMTTTGPAGEDINAAVETIWPGSDVRVEAETRDPKGVGKSVRRPGRRRQPAG